MSLIPYYLQYVSEICEGTRKAPAGIVLTEQEDLKKALQLQAEITKLGIPAFVKACAEADGTEIPQEEYDSFDPAELNTAIAQLAEASQPQEPAEEAPQEPVRTETRDIFEIFLDSVCLDDALLTYLIDILKRRSEPEFAKLSHAAARTELKLDDFLAWLGNKELWADDEERVCAAVMDACLERLRQEGRLELLARLFSSQLITKGERHLLDHSRVYYRVLRTILAEGQQRGQIRDDVTVNELSKLYALLERGLMYDWCICNGDYSLKSYAERTMPMLLAAFQKK